MRKLILTALVTLPLIAVGGLVYAHAGQEETAPAAEAIANCPLQMLHDLVHSAWAEPASAETEHCPLQHLREHLGL